MSVQRMRVLPANLSLVVILLCLQTALPGGLRGANVPAGWQVTGFGRGRAATDQTADYDSGRWYVKTGPSRSAIVYQSLSGDVSIVAKIQEASGQPNARMGLMLWSSISATAGNVGLFIDPQAQNLTFTWDEVSERPQIGANSIQCQGLGFPIWLKLTKTGSYFAAAYSKDGQDWRPVGLRIKTFWAGNRPEVFASLYADGICEQRLSDVRIDPAPAIPALPPLPDDWSLDILGLPDFVGEAREAHGTWTLTGANTKGRGGYHNVTVQKPLPTKVQLTAKIQTAQLTDTKSSGGLLFSAHGTDVGIMASPAAGKLHFFTRRSSDGRWLQVRSVPLPSNLAGQAEGYLRLALVDGRVAAFHGPTTSDWTQVGDVLSVTELAADVKGGLELFSDSASRYVAAVNFTNVSIEPLTALPVKTPPATATPVAAPTTPRPATAVQNPAPAPYRPPTVVYPERSGMEKFAAGLFALLRLLLWLVLLAAIFLAKPFNTLVRWRNQTKKAWAQIDVQLKRRHDLILNYVETVKGYAKHEQATLEGVTRARAAAVNASTPGEMAKAEEKLNATMQSLYAVVEAYPDLKANQNFAALQNNLADTENKIAATRHAYNEEVAHYNTKVQSFPTNLVARLFRFKECDFFELKSDTEREAPKPVL